MRTIQATQIIDAVANLCIDSNRYLPRDVRERFTQCAATE